MDASLRNLLSSSEDAQALCQGMEFLRSASRNSIIASRYIAMLSNANKALPPQARIESDCAPLGQARNLQPDRSNTSPAVDEEAVATGSDAAAEETQANSVPEHSLPQHGGLDGLVNDFDFTQLDSMFSYDLLFGTGLPQEIVPKDWPPHDGMIL
ncbi:hypothetical protein NW767_010799 [Fusarium falciforme]|nr:hypothetical protein NW767_010799 [Fusarium falciforme]